jgi:pseudouridine-5'-phosphate glycosidase
VPVPEDQAADPAQVEEAIAQALSEAAEAGVRGKEVTPFLLSRVAQLTGGKSVNANLALLRQNAAVAAQIAVALAGPEG